MVTVARRGLLERWTRDYSFFNGNGVVLDWLAARGTDQVLDRLSGRTDACVTGTFAARTYLRDGVVPIVPGTLLTLYTRELRALGDNLGLGALTGHGATSSSPHPETPPCSRPPTRPAL